MQSGDERVLGVVGFYLGVVRRVVVHVVLAPQFLGDTIVGEHLCPYLAPCVVVSPLERGCSGIIWSALRTQRTGACEAPTAEGTDVFATYGGQTHLLSYKMLHKVRYVNVLSQPLGKKITARLMAVDFVELLLQLFLSSLECEHVRREEVLRVDHLVDRVDDPHYGAGYLLECSHHALLFQASKNSARQLPTLSTEALAAFNSSTSSLTAKL